MSSNYDDIDVTSWNEPISPEQMINELAEADMHYMPLGEVVQLAHEKVLDNYAELDRNTLTKRYMQLMRM